MQKPLTIEETALCHAILALERGGDAAWHSTAKFIALPEVAGLIVGGATLTPYTHLHGYMDRFWVLNPYDFSGGAKGERELPSVRVHHILRADLDDYPHDHPWPARTIILKGWYVEERLMPDGSIKTFKRVPGDTASLQFGEYHRITEVSEGGVWTLFITYGYQGTWGFLVDGKKVPWREYLATPKPGRSGMPATTEVAGA